MERVREMSASLEEAQLFKNRQKGIGRVENLLGWTVVAWLALILAVATLVFGGAYPPIRVHLGWMFGVLLILHGIAVFSSRTPQIRLHPIAFLFLPFIVWTIVSAVYWSPLPWAGWREALIYLWTAAALWVVHYHVNDKPKAWTLLATIGVLGIILLLTGFWQVFRDVDWLPWGRVQPVQYHGRAGGMLGAPNQFGFYMLAASLIALVLALAPRLGVTWRIACGYLAALFFAGMIVSYSKGAYLAAGAALSLLPFLLLSRWKSRLIALVVLVVLGGVGITVLWANLDLFQSRVGMSIRHGGDHIRPQLWTAAWEIFRDHPIAGSGAASYDAAFERHRPEGMNMRPLYAHGDYLNTLSDHGSVGFLLLFGPGGLIAAAFVRGWWRKPARVLLVRTGREVMPTVKVILSASLVVLVALAVHLVVEFHLKVPGMLILLAILVGIAGNLSLHPVVRLPGSFLVRTGLGVLLVGAGVGLGLGSWTAFRADSTYLRAFEGQQAWFDNYRDYAEKPEEIAAVIANFREATEIDPNLGDAWADLGYSILQSHYVREESASAVAREALEPLRRAVALSDGVWRYQSYLGLALWIGGGDREEARAHLARGVELAPNRPEAWRYYADFLSWFPDWKEEAKAAVATALKLDPKHPKTVTLKRKLLAP